MKAILVVIVVSIMLVGIIYVTTNRGSNAEILTREISRQGELGMDNIVVIGVISDTHIPARANEIPTKVFEVFKGVDYIIHAGDVVRLEVIKQLEKIAPVTAVHGNMDPYEVREVFPKITSLEVYGWKIGVVHDSISPWKMGKMREIAKENDFDVLIFGHTHRPFVKKDGGRLYINPGSPTNPFLTRPSVALLEIRGEEIEARIVEI